MIKAVVFDFDGLILDTETPWYHAFKQIYHEHGHDLPLELWAGCIGTTFDAFNPYDYLEKCLERSVDREMIKQNSKTHYTKFMLDQSLRPGVEQYLQSAKTNGLRIGLASSSTRSWVESYLKQYHLLDYFDSIHTADDVLKVKPDPELYLLALDALGVQGHEAIAFEDSLHGSMAAHAAGIRTVIVPNEVTSLLDFVGYSLRLTTMEEMSLDEVLLKLNHEVIIKAAE